MRSVGFRSTGLLLLTACLAATAPAWATLISAPGGAIVNDSQGISWLANANLASNPAYYFGVKPCSSTKTSDCINSSGSMDYQAAMDWVNGMNLSHYLGQSNWQLPTTAVSDTGCTGLGAQTNGFAFNCSGSAMGSLFYNGLALKAPNSVVAPLSNTVGVFTNLQPNLYWSDTPATSKQGYLTFSFATGWSGSNIGDNATQPNGVSTKITGNYLDVLPMIPGTPTPGGGKLQLSADGQTVHDPVTGATWLADGNVAATFAKNPSLLQAIGMQLCNGIGTPNTVVAPCINADGTMNHSSAVAFINGLNSMNGKTGYLGMIGWELPPVPVNPVTLAPLCSGFGCSASNNPMGSLFYNKDSLALSQGQSVDTSGSTDGWFSNVQNYLYWSCPAASAQTPVALSPCSPDPQCASVANGGTCGANMDWSFDLGNGFQGTDEAVNYLFVLPYFVDAPEPTETALLLCGLGLVITMRRKRRV